MDWPDTVKLLAEAWLMLSVEPPETGETVDALACDDNDEANEPVEICG